MLVVHSPSLELILSALYILVNGSRKVQVITGFIDVKLQIIRDNPGNGSNLFTAHEQERYL